MKGVLRYLARRLVFAILLVFLVSSGGLLLTRLAPGDFTSELYGTGVSAETIARERARYGLDRPVLEQYAGWLWRASHLDLGVSLMYRRPVGELVRQRAANTALLAVIALGLATLVGLPLGIISGSRRGGILQAAIRTASLVTLSLPSLLTSLLFVLIAARTGWFPIGGMLSVDATGGGWVVWLRDLAWHLPVPVLALALPVAATLERLQSQAVAETMAEPFVLAAAARGVPRRRILWRSVLRVAIRPVASIYGLVLAGLLSGSFVVEIVTAWPGLGRLMFDALRARDIYLVAGCAVAGSIFLAAGSLLSDVALAVADPRLREEPAP
jgi:peptide/nickel transport system permease protein